VKKDYKDILTYLKATIALIEGLDKPDTREDSNKFKIAVLSDVQNSLGRLIQQLS